MMRRSCALLLAAVLLAACGDDDDGNGNGNGNGGGGGNGGGNTGTIDVGGGSSFTVREAVALSSSLTCADLGVSGGAQTVAVILSDTTGVCALAEQGSDKANSAAFTVFVVRGNLQGQAPAAIGPGTYPVIDLSAGVPTTPGPVPGVQLDLATGNFTFASAAFGRNDAACNDTSTDATDAVSGSVILTSVTSSRIQGSVDLTLRNNARVTRPFDAPVCAGLGDLVEGFCGGAEPVLTCAP